MGNKKEKRDLVVLGQGHKDIRNLSLFGDESANSQKMVSFRYKIPCFRNDGVYQLHRSIENIGVAASKADQNLRGGDHPMDTLDITLADGTRRKFLTELLILPDMGEMLRLKFIILIR
jgi:hypothetical protein